VFAVETNGAEFMTLHSFVGYPSEGEDPSAGLILSGDALYGTTYQGGSSANGTVFKVNVDGTGFTTLHSFTELSGTNSANSDGAYPLATLFLLGNTLYGTAQRGGTVGNGAVFTVNTDGSDFTTLHSFASSEGRFPEAGLILSGSTFYGTTYEGGAGLGTIYEINVDGSGFTTLYQFTNANLDANPAAGLTISGSVLYGTAIDGGSGGDGTVFALILQSLQESSLQPYKDIGEPKLNCCVGYPIGFGTGNLFQEVTDYKTVAANRLAFVRYFNTFGDTNTRAVMLGTNWRSTYDRYLRITLSNSQPVFVIMERSDGQELQFTNNGGRWTSYSDVDLTLVQSGSLWIVTNVNDSIETYSSVTASLALLSSIQARDGCTQTLQYNAGNQLLSVSDSFGRTFQFAYNGSLLHTLTMPDGLVVTYGYNSSGVNPGVLNRLASATYSTVPQTSVSYQYENTNFPFSLTGIIDEDGNRYATFAYDSTGRAVLSQHANGADLTTIGFNADGSCDLTNALGLATLYQFTNLQAVPKVTQTARLSTVSSAAASMTFGYDTNGYVSAIEDWNGNVTMFVNDVHGQPTIINEAVGTAQARTTTNTYLANFHLPAQIAAPREIINFAYDGLGNLLTQNETDTSTGTVPYSTSGQSRTWTYTYGSFGEVATATGPRTDVNATSAFTYDDSGNVSTVTDPLGHITRFTSYNGSGLPLTMIDPNGVVTSMTYDVRDRLLSRTVQAASGNATSSFGYDAAGLLTSSTLPNGVFLNYQYDAAHRLQSVSDGLGESIVYALDAAGDVTQQSIKNAGGAVTKTQSSVFDALGRKLQDIGASSQTTTYSYDSDGNCLSITDGLNNTTTRTFDALNRMVASVDPLGHSTGFGYDAQDNLISVTDPRSLVTGYFYDGFGQKIEDSSPDKGTTVYMLDKAGNRISETDARGVVTQGTFDALDRVTSESFPASIEENMGYEYDSTIGGNFGVGRLTAYADETGSTALAYNERGDITNSISIIEGQPYTNGYAYDLADNVTNMLYPSGDSVRYGRDSQGRINWVSFVPISSGVASVLATNVAYMPFGPLLYLVYGNNLARTQTYDGDYRLTAITTLGVQTNIQNLALSYDNVNDVASIADNLDGTQSQSFGYDPDYRLTKVTGVEGPVQFTYDPVGNRASQRVAGSTQTYAYSAAANQLMAVTGSGASRNFSYTATGNMASDNRASPTPYGFTYGNRNRLNALTIGGVSQASYQYNAGGERVVKKANGGTTHYHYNQNHQLIAESQPDGTVTMQYVWLGDNGQITLHTYGEGNSYEQAPALQFYWGDKVEQVWQNNQSSIFKRSVGP
jgi:uncharacterized repeat protein (TIGR03803 family)/YD repeat-containing protein